MPSHPQILYLLVITLWTGYIASQDAEPIVNVITFTPQDFINVTHSFPYDPNTQTKWLGAPAVKCGDFSAGALLQFKYPALTSDWLFVSNWSINSTYIPEGMNIYSIQISLLKRTFDEKTLPSDKQYVICEDARDLSSCTILPASDTSPFVPFPESMNTIFPESEDNALWGKNWTSEMLYSINFGVGYQAVAPNDTSMSVDCLSLRIRYGTGTPPPPPSTFLPPSTTEVTDLTSTVESSSTQVPVTDVTNYTGDEIDMESSQKNGSNAGTIAGATVGVIVGLLCIAGVIFGLIVLKRRRIFGAGVTSELDVILDKSLYLSDIKIEQTLGRGKFGEVNKGSWNGVTPVALKKLKGSEDKKSFENEGRLLLKLNHPNIVQALGFYIDEKGENYLVMEFMSQGALSEFIRRQNPSETSLSDLLVMALHAAAGCAYLEKMKVVHRDLAARNLLVSKVDDKFIVKVADFGMGREVSEELYTGSTDIFAVKWSAPEVIQYRKYTHKSDVWSFGVCLWELFEFGKVPYPSYNNTETTDKVLGGYRLPRPEACPEELYVLMMACWHEKPENRPTFQHIYETISSILKRHQGEATKFADVFENS